MAWPVCCAAGHQVWGHGTAPGAGVCDTTLAEATGVHSTTKCVLLAEHCRGSAVAAGAVGVLSGISSSGG